MAPFSSNKSGQSYGAGNPQFEIGNANGSNYVKLGFGASQNMDLGYVMEFGDLSTSGLFLKYSFLNQKIGGSYAMELGYGGSESSNYYYLGLIGSYAFTEYIELFINPRLTKVTTSDKDIEFGETIGNIVVSETDLAYLYLASGINIWLNDSFGISLYTIYINGSGIETERNFSSAMTGMFRF